MVQEVQHLPKKTPDGLVSVTIVLQAYPSMLTVKENFLQKWLVQTHF